MDLRLKCNTYKIKLLKENIEGKLLGIGFDNNFLAITSKAKIVLYIQKGICKGGSSGV